MTKLRNGTALYFLPIIYFSPQFL